MSEFLRDGQRAYNDLYDQDPEVALLILGTSDDPFYDDSRLAAFNARVGVLRRELGR
jgi:hypothetical protein